MSLEVMSERRSDLSVTTMWDSMQQSLTKKVGPLVVSLMWWRKRGLDRSSLSFHCLLYGGLPEKPRCNVDLRRPRNPDLSKNLWGRVVPPAFKGRTI